MNAEKPVQFDKKLELTILPPAPALHILFSPIPQDLLAGEIIPVTVNLTNAGTETLTDIYVVAEDPRWVLGDITGNELPLSLLKGKYDQPQHHSQRQLTVKHSTDFKDLTNESLSRDREIRKQHAFKLLSPNEGTGGILHPKESKSTVIWLQAPFIKGQTTIKLLFYYGMPAHYPKIKYRLVRHMWTLNVNESLCVDVNCNISNTLTNELGLDVNIKNQNQVVHALMTEISLSHLTLFCDKYKLNPNRINCKYFGDNDPMRMRFN